MRAYTDGACRKGNPGQCSCAWAILDEHGLECHSDARYLGPELHTNNYSEYQGLLDLLMWTEANKVIGLDIYCDSQLVVKQMNGEWRIKHKDLQPLRDLAYALLVRGNHRLHWIRGHEMSEMEEDRIGNTYVDKLCNQSLDVALGAK